MTSQLVKAATLCTLVLAALPTQAAPVLGQGTWETTLQARDINGDGKVDAYFDRALNITWLADWDVYKQWKNGEFSVYWREASAWASSLDVYGVTGWRLPLVSDDGGSNSPCAAAVNFCGTDPGVNSSELAHMWYETLGNIACYPGDPCYADGKSEMTNTANFVNMYGTKYWSGASYGTQAGAYWDFDLYRGYQYFAGQYAAQHHAIAVRDGDVPTFSNPEPSVLALVAAGLLGIAATRRRKPATRTA